MVFSGVSTLWTFEVAKFLIINNIKVACYNIVIVIIELLYFLQQQLIDFESFGNLSIFN